MAEEVEETQETEEQTKKEPTVEERLAAMEASLSEERQNREQAEERYKDVSGRLTRTQQESAEMTKFLKSVLPEINGKKNFQETWDDSPEDAVRDTASREVAPLADEISDLRLEQMRSTAQMHNAMLLGEHPEWKKYENKVVALGDDYPKHTMTRDGLQKLYKMAQAEDPDTLKRLEEIESNGRAEMQKSRAYTESSGNNPPPSNDKTPSSDERRVAKLLGIKPEDYMTTKNKRNARGHYAARAKENN